MPAKNGAKQPAPSGKRAYLAERPYRQSVILLVIGDVMCFLIFAYVGDASHNQFRGLASVLNILAIALPFLAGWFIVAPFMGMFRKELMTAPRAMAYRTAYAWIPAWVIAMALWGIFFDQGIPPASFMIVAFLFNLVILEIWRWPFALNGLARKRGG